MHAKAGQHVLAHTKAENSLINRFFSHLSRHNQLFDLETFQGNCVTTCNTMAHIWCLETLIRISQASQITVTPSPPCRLSPLLYRWT